MSEEMKSTELIEVIQLPQLKEQFEIIGKEVQEKVKRAEGLVCSNENYKDIKKIRAELNKEFKAYEAEFKAVKEKVLAPWQAVEDAYKKHIKDGYKTADECLKMKISEVESDLKAEKESEVIRYFREYAAINMIDFIRWEETNIKVGLSDSMKSLKERVKELIDKTSDDVEIIRQNEHAPEIMIEYKRCRNAAEAIRIVNERIAAKLAEEKRLEEEEERKEAEQAVVDEVERNMTEPVAPPVVEQMEEEPEEEQAQEPEKELKKAAFCVQGTIGQLIGLAEYMQGAGIEYFNIDIHKSEITLIGEKKGGNEND